MMQKYSVTPRQKFALRNLSMKLGDPLGYEYLDKLDKQEANKLIKEYIKELKGKNERNRI